MPTSSIFRRSSVLRTLSKPKRTRPHCTTIRAIKTVARTSHSIADIDVAQFRDRTFTPSLPLHFRPGPSSTSLSALAQVLPAATKWFSRKDEPEAYSLAGNFSSDENTVFDFAYMNRFEDVLVQYEFTATSRGSAPCNLSAAAALGFSFPLPSPLLSSPQPQSRPPESYRHVQFARFTAPLQLLLHAHRQNLDVDPNSCPDANFTRGKSFPCISGLYVAQQAIPDLPAPLRSDLPTPELVLRAGRGDVYASGVWLGLEPTYTPLHRDPNPNLFVQLCGAKRVRMMAPESGRWVFERARREVADAAGSGGDGGGGRIRGEEMMQGEEREVLARAVWGREVEGTRNEGGEEDRGGEGEERRGERKEEGIDGIMEAELLEGDALFVPLGWWHSVRSDGPGRLNGSVNWWFR